MSEENMRIARQLYPGTMDAVALLANAEALGPVFEALVHPDFETVADPRFQMLLGDPVAEVPAGSPQMISYGIAGFVSTFSDWLSAWDSWAVTPTDFIEVDENRVLVAIDIRARSKTHGAEIATEGANVLAFRDGKVERLELFLRLAEALEAAGLSE